MGFLAPHVTAQASNPTLPPQVNQPQGSKPNSADQNPSFLGAALLPITGATGQPTLSGNVGGKTQIGN